MSLFGGGQESLGRLGNFAALAGPEADLAAIGQQDVLESRLVGVGVGCPFKREPSGIRREADDSARRVADFASLVKELSVTKYGIRTIRLWGLA